MFEAVQRKPLLIQMNSWYYYHESMNIGVTESLFTFFLIFENTKWLNFSNKIWSQLDNQKHIIKFVI